MTIQKAKSYSFRVKSMSDENWHVILVPDKGHIICSCAGVNWCSHIEATLVAGERAMVPEAERSEANRAQIAARGRLEMPKNWKSTWRKNRRWRGLPPIRESMAQKSLKEGVPVVSIEGRGRAKRDIENLSKKHGWMISRQPVKGVLFHVVPDGQEASISTQKAVDAQIPVATYSQWVSISEELAKILGQEISSIV